MRAMAEKPGVNPCEQGAGGGRDRPVRKVPTGTEIDTMAHAALSTLSSMDPSGAARVRKIACRVYGALAVVVGLAGCTAAGAFVWLGSTGALPAGTPLTAGGVATLLAPAVVLLGLGALIFRQNVVAAIVLVGVMALHDALIHPLAISVCSGPLSFGLPDAIAYGLMLSLTAVVVVADCAARSAEIRR
jgi:hypothetical protein